jgi:hypothetical protein
MFLALARQAIPANAPPELFNRMTYIAQSFIIGAFGARDIISTIIHRHSFLNAGHTSAQLYVNEKVARKGTAEQ